MEGKMTLNFQTKLIGVSLILALAACAETKQEPHLGSTIATANKNGAAVVMADTRTILPSGGLAGEEATIVEIQAKVDAIDLAGRSITLALPDGGARRFAVSKDIRNFSQIKKGDTVKVNYRQTLTFELREPTPEEIALSGTEVKVGSRAKLGELPAGAVTTQRLLIATIDSVSTEAQEVGLKTADGRVVKIKAKYPENLSLVKPGQKAVINYGETVLAAVQRVE